MALKVPARVLRAVFSRVFRSPKSVTASVLPQLVAAAEAVSRIGAKRLKEFLAAFPIFILFVRELLRRRSEVGSQKRLAVIGAAAAFSTLLLVALGGLLGSLPVQLLLVFTHPWVGVPLFLSTGLVLTCVMVVLSWLIVYVLNLAMGDDPVYRSVRDQFMPPTTQELLAQVQSEIEQSGADLEALRQVVEERLKARGSTADAEKLEKELQRLEKRVRSVAGKKLKDLGESVQAPSGSDVKPAA